jgi:hypothetical protein
MRAHFSPPQEDSTKAFHLENFHTIARMPSAGIPAWPEPDRFGHPAGK